MIGNIVAGLIGEVALEIGDFESIATVTVGAGGAANATFTSIPATYQHLQIRYVVRSTVASTQDVLEIEFNSDTAGGNYARHWVNGQGTTAASYGEGNFQDNLRVTSGNTAGTGTFGVGVIDILDYANTNKNKTTRTLSGIDNNGSGQVALGSGLWKSTTAINSILLKADGGNLAQYSHIALYGIKG